MERLKELRTAKHVSQQDVADYLEITRQAYSNYETGKRAPDNEMLLKLSEYYDVTVDYILRGQEMPATQMDGELTIDDFVYALHNESRTLTPENKAKLLDMARMLTLAQRAEETDDS